MPLKLCTPTRLLKPADLMKRNLSALDADPVGHRTKCPRSSKAARDIIPIDCEPNVLEIDCASTVAVSKKATKGSCDNFAVQIAQQTGLPERKVVGALNLLGAGNTLPFIARYVPLTELLTATSAMRFRYSSHS